MQKKRLYKMLLHAKEDVTYYANNEKFEMTNITEENILKKMVEIPVLEKNDAVLHNNEFLANDCVPLMLQNKLLWKNTSGSTGKYMEIYWKNADYQRSLMPLYFRRKRDYGIEPADRLCYFYSSRKLGREEILTERKPGQLGFCKSGLNEERLLEIYHNMLEFSPVWIMGQPSVLLLLAQIKEKHELPCLESLKYIELTGEMLFSSIREEIEKAFSCKIANHYGSMEVNTIAFECPCGNLHLTDSTYTEIIDEAGRPLPPDVEGDVCITTLENHAFPMIRFRVGDRGIISSKKCKCGGENEIFELASGRINDYIVTRDGLKINSYVFVRAIYAVNSCLQQEIKQFSIIQKDYDRFQVKLVTESTKERGAIEKIFLDNIYQKELENAVYEFEFYDTLFPGETGKVKYFFREDF